MIKAEKELDEVLQINHQKLASLQQETNNPSTPNIAKGLENTVKLTLDRRYKFSFFWSDFLQLTVKAGLVLGAPHHDRKAELV